ncbi:hypothetical protein ACLMJK_009246 [Lecanora helva]
MTKLYKAQPLSQVSRPKTKLVRRLGRQARKALRTAKEVFPFNKRNIVRNEGDEIQVQHANPETLRQLADGASNSDVRNVVQTLLPSKSITTPELSEGRDPADTDATRRQPLVEAKSSPSSTGRIRNFSAESLLFVGRTLRDASSYLHNLEVDGPAIEESTASISASDNEVDTEGGVLIEEHKASLPVENSLISSPVADTTISSEDGEHKLGENIEVFGSTSWEMCKCLPSLNSSPMIDSPSQSSVATSTPTINLWKRKKRQNILLPSDSDRSVSESTLVGSPLTPSPRSVQFPFKRPATSDHRVNDEDDGDNDNVNPLRAALPFFPEGLEVASSLSSSEAEIQARIQGAVEDAKAALGRKFASRMAEAKRTVKTWQDASDAMEHNHRADLNNVKEKYEVRIEDLERQHSALREAKRKNEKDMRQLRKEVRALQSENRSHEDAYKVLYENTQNLTAKLAVSEDNYTQALKQIQHLRGHSDSSMTAGEWQARYELAEVQRDYEACYQQGRYYLAKTRELQDILSEDPQRAMLVGDIVAEKEEAVAKQRAIALEYRDALRKEQNERAADQAGFDDAIEVAAAGSRQATIDMRGLDMSRDEAWAQVQELLQRYAKGMTRSEYDSAMDEHYKQLNKAKRELTIKVRGLDLKAKERHTELNKIRRQMRLQEVAKTASNKDYEDEISRLELESKMQENTIGALQFELEIARSDEDNREPGTSEENPTSIEDNNLSYECLEQVSNDEGAPTQTDANSDNLAQGTAGSIKELDGYKSPFEDGITCYRWSVSRRLLFRDV